MQRRAFIKASAAAVSATSLSSMAFAGPAKRPNVVFLLTDQWRAQATGYAGDPNARTPVLDALASQSTNFTNAVSGLPLCCPARASLITGQYPLKHGVFINDVQLKPNTDTLGEAFKKAGYRTGYIGKWHLHGSPDGRYGRRNKYVPADQRFGFDYWKGNEVDHEYNHERYFTGDDPTPKFWPGYAPFAQTSDAIDFIDGAKADTRPFFLMLSVGPPHFPRFTAPETYKDMFADADIQLRPNVPTSFAKRAVEGLRGYYAHAAALDDCVQRLLKALETSGLGEDTIFVFTSDHGEMMFSQGLEGKLYPWDEAIRVPLLIRYPRKLGSRGKRITTPIGQPDVMPTLLGLADIPVPEGIQGIDLSSVMVSGRSRGGPRSALLTNPVSTLQLRLHGMDSFRGVRTERHTYVRSIKGPWLLYDNERDPYQKSNLIGTAAGKALIPEMEAELQMWLRRTGDAFLPGATYLDQAGLSHYRETQSPIGTYHSPWGDWESTMGS